MWVISVKKKESEKLRQRVEHIIGKCFWRKKIISKRRRAHLDSDLAIRSPVVICLGNRHTACAYTQWRTRALLGRSWHSHLFWPKTEARAWLAGAGPMMIQKSPKRRVVFLSFYFLLLQDGINLKKISSPAILGDISVLTWQPPSNQTEALFSSSDGLQITAATQKHLRTHES